MRFFYGKQLYIFSKYIDNKLYPNNENKDSQKKCINELNKKKAFSLIKYLTGLNINSIKGEDQILAKIKNKFKNIELENVENNLEKISFYLEKLLENVITVKEILSRNEIKDKKYKGLFIIDSEQNSYEIHILKWFYKLTNNLPLPFTLLICTNNTSEEELISFLYRAFYCKHNILFFLQNIEDLSNSQRKLLVNMLKDKDFANLNSSLIISYYSKDSDIYKAIIKIEGHKKLNEVEKKNNMSNIMNNINKLINKIYTVSSNSTGAGKSFYIKQKAKIDKLKYIYFPVGGSYSKEQIINRLNKLILSDENYFDNALLHLDLSETDNDYLTREIIFSFAILYKYGNNDNTICLSNNIFLFIEIPYGFSDFKERFQILKIFKKEEFDIQNLRPLFDDSVPKDIIEKSDIQIVAGVLNLFDNHLIINQNLDLKSNKRMSTKACETIIRRHFNIENPNYYQITTFIKVMSYQCKNLIQSAYLSTEEMGEVNLLNIRNFMVDALIKITRSFIEGVFKRLISNQIESKNNINNKNIREIALKALTKEQDMISFDKFKPSLIFFNEDKQSLSIITSCQKSEQEYKNLEKLYNSQSRDGQKYNLLDYKKLNSDQILAEIKKVLNINNANLDDLKNYTNSYVFTADNFIKLILILTRVRAGVPIIMMGETGCGKTSLLRVLSKLQNKGELKMKIKNIHAGTEEEDIIEFMEKTEKEFNEENEELINKEKKEFDENKKNYEQQGKKFYDEKKYFENFIQNLPKLWVFFDEINTCNCLGLISEILCHHTYRGKEINKNIVLFAACNPYRILTKKNEEIGLKNKINNIKRNYVYSVNPLPHSLLNFVFDFGNLKKEDEERYINSMVEKTFESFCSLNKLNNKDKEYKNLSKNTSECISICQNFIREFCDISSVSLREIRRFDLLFKWFNEYYIIKKEVLEVEKKKNSNIKQSDNVLNFLKKKKVEICKNSINLSIYMCYYIRISNKRQRKKLSLKLDKYFDNNFLKIPIEESLYIVENVKLERGTAKNEALLENIFSIFVCILNKIPLFIVGKPGTSKSMSVQLIYNSMKGQNSANSFFKKYKSLFLYPYQGSDTSTSKGVLNIFKKARAPIKNSIENKKEINFISAVFFDEMGLAENSTNNPLKVIHSQLEYDENEYKVAFIGISNWVLDASKMNRGISLLLPEPELNDLIETSEKIAQSYDENILEKYKELFIILSKTYYDYKKRIKNKKIEDFHGNRDFYHLIKIAAKKIIKYDEEMKNNLLNINDESKLRSNKIIEEIAISSLERNFGGLDNSLNDICELFYTYYGEKSIVRKYNVLNCIQENLLDKESRYLLLISKSSISTYLLNLIFNKMSIQYNFYIGSKFIDEKESQDYSVKKLNNIQLQMESGGILVLQNLELIYPSLYDLFNQNFTRMGNKNMLELLFLQINHIH